MGSVILKWFGKVIGNDKIPVELVINHEHGDKTKKCHRQVFIKFKKFKEKYIQHILI